MGKVFAAGVQCVLFLLTFLVGSLLLHPFHLTTTLASDAAHTRVFLWDGLLLMLLLYGLVLLLELATKRLRGFGLGTTLALLVAGVAGLAMKFGFLSVDR